MIIKGVPDDPEAREVTIAGHPGLVTTRDKSSYEYQVSVSDTLKGKGSMELTVSTGPLTGPDVPLPAGTDRKAEAVLADVLETYAR